MKQSIIDTVQREFTERVRSAIALRANLVEREKKYADDRLALHDEERAIIELAVFLEDNKPEDSEAAHPLLKDEETHYLFERLRKVGATNLR